MNWHYFPLHRDTPGDGLLLEQLFAGTGMDIKASNQRMKALTSAEGLPFNPLRSKTFNSRKAQELAKWSDANQTSDLLHPQIYEAYFVRGENLADLDVLMNIVELSGLQTEDARLSLQSRQYKQAVDKDWEYASSMGVTGIPTFVYAGYGLVGAQPYQELLRLIK